MKAHTFFILAISFFLVGCISYYHLGVTELTDQLKTDSTRVEGTLYVPIATPSRTIPIFTRYPANRLKKILCYNSDGEQVYFYPNQNTIFEFTSKSTKDVVKMYYDTIFLEGDKIVGLRSRIITTMTCEILTSDIEKIEIYTEGGKAEKVKTD